MNLKRFQLSLDPRMVMHLRLLAEEEQLSLVELIREVLHQYLRQDVRNRRNRGGAEVVAGEAFAYAPRQEQAEDREALRAWIALSPEARWHAAENGLVQPPWPALEAAEQADQEMREARDFQAPSKDGKDGSADDGRVSEGSGAETDGDCPTPEGN